jgi:hypothetical protein
MLINKELKPTDTEYLITPFYTSCCDKLFIEADPKSFYNVEIMINFPYLSKFKIANDYVNTDDDEEVWSCKYVSEDDIISFGIDNSTLLPNYSACIICEDCLIKNSSKLINSFSVFTIDQPISYTLKELRTACENYVDFAERENLLTENYVDFAERGNLLTKDLYKSLHPSIAQAYLKNYYMYISRKHNFLIKKELSLFFAKRNLNILKQHYPISQDIISVILKNF